MGDLELTEAPRQTNSFEITNTELRSFTVNKNVGDLAEYGGAQGLAKKLKTDLDNGLPESEVEEGFITRQTFFGKNEFVEPPMDSLLTLIINSLKEPILILLLIASVVSIFFGLFLEESTNGFHVNPFGWVEGTAIMIAVFLVVGVTAGNDYSKEIKFRQLNKIKNDRPVKVKRGGKEDKVSITTIQVGDVIVLGTGDQVPADGVYLDGYDLSVDESAMTGESKAAKKSKDEPFMLSGCQVSTGTGLMLVTAVGMNSEWGITYSKLQEKEVDEEGNEKKTLTPLQEKLEVLAKMIGWVGMGVAGTLFVVLTIIFIVKHTTSDEPFKASSMIDFVKFVLLCITIVVVAVPEGLPLAVTIALAYSMKSMLKDNNLVRHLAACETMGGATNICSDKTGTLTENLMTVTHTWIGGTIFSGDLETTLPASNSSNVLDMLCESSCVNSNAFLKWNEKSKKKDFIGSTTECALLILSEKLGKDYSKIRKESKVLTLVPFSSDRKRMSTCIALDKGSRLHTKGASEIILELCTTYMDNKGNVVALTDNDKEKMKKTIEELASEGLRTLSIAYKNLPDQPTEFPADVSPETELTLIAIVGIKDPLRKEVPLAIQQCKSAGITVRMVTGDNKLTATKIAQDCGILEEGQMVLEGPDFRKMTDEELDAILPKLRVLARSSPSDKHRLVTRLRHHREVVAATGDGTNDGPALKAADVGLAMGIAGTEIAKEASDIIIMDDNFASIVKAVMWGRCVRRNIQKFLQFQLTVNVVALSLAFVAAVSGEGEPLTPIQLLWVNLIQDTMGALALATEKPSMELLNLKPTGRRERLITPTMWRNILMTAGYELMILYVIVYEGHRLFNMTEDVGLETHDSKKQATVRFTVVFNTFVYMAAFNEINARRLDNYWNAFEKFFANYIFTVVILITAIIQIPIICFGGSRAFQVTYINWKYWLICLCLAVTILPFGVLNRVLIPAPEFDFIKYERPKKKKKGANKDGKEEEDERDENLTAMELP